MPALIGALDELGWHLPRPVQTEAAPLILGGGDVAVAAETGAGKTGAFCIPLLQTVYETLHAAPRAQAPPPDPSAPLALSAADRSRDVALDGCAAQCRRAVAWQGARATRGVGRGRWYYVARPEDEGLCRLGWSGGEASLNLGTDARGLGYGGTGKKSLGGKFDDYGGPYGKGDRVACLLAIEEGRVHVRFLRNGEDLGPAFEGVDLRRVAGAGGVLYPAVALKNAQVSVDFMECDAAADAMGYRLVAEAAAEDCAPAVVEEEGEGEDAMDVDSGARAVTEPKRLPLALILEPSRELAEQVHGELEKLSGSLETASVRRMLLVGGGNPRVEAEALRAGVDIVAGTLGSVMKQVRKGALSLDNIRFFVLDEADTFATDNLGDVLQLHEAVPPRNQVQTLLFSATLHSPAIRNLSEKIQRFPTWIDLKGKEAIPETVHHTLVRLDADADIALVTAFEKAMKEGATAQGTAVVKPFAWPSDGVHTDEVDDAADQRSAAMKKIKLAALKRVIDANEMHHAMVFARTQQDCDNIERFLLACSGVLGADRVDRARFRGSRESGAEVEYSCAVLHGGRRPDERHAALAAFRNQEVRFLVCTDVAARGIDITGLPYLVNVTLPDKSENYIHRVGRVGRSEMFGLAISLVAAQKEAVWFHSCNRPKDGRCKNRKLVDAGGCVLWYNESKLLEDVEERLNGQVEELDADFKRKGGADAPPILYGGMRDTVQLGAATAVHIESLKPAVRELVQMENDAQALFFNLQARYQIALPYG